MSGARALLGALRAELDTRAARAALLGAIALGAALGLANEGADARGLFAYAVVPLLLALLGLGAPLARARSRRTGSLDLERVHGAGALARTGATALARAIACTLAAAAALCALELALAARDRAGVPPHWTARPFEDLPRRRLEHRGAALSLPSFPLDAGQRLIVPLRWRGDERDPVRLAVLLRPSGTDEVLEREERIASSTPLVITAPGPGRFEALLLHRGGAGELRFDLPLARLELAPASHGGAAAAFLARALALALGLAATSAALAVLLPPGLAVASVAAGALALLGAPLLLGGGAAALLPDLGALLAPEAWVSGRPEPRWPEGAAPLAALGALGLAAAALGEARRRAP
ncbi:MAG: hypothetical protein IPN34_11925 [Planctomycetes bacterium]|nr:hypothetical protein [Planctomycetota bacterium]